MADHYGDAELIIGHHRTNSAKHLQVFTKWCPAEAETATFQQAEEAVDLASSRMRQTEITLLQYHAWDYTSPSYLHNFSHLRTLQTRGKILHLGLTNFDAAHLELLIDSGFTIATNQVSVSVIDRRLVSGRLAAVCIRHGVKILAYGTLLGGFLLQRWLDAPEPQESDGMNWSLQKYLRFIHAAGLK